MNVRSLKSLRIGASILGWLIILGIASNIYGYVEIFRKGLSVSTVFPGMIGPFSLASALGSFFSSFGNAFFAFLIAAVFLMIERQVPVGNEHANRLMIVCCFSYLADAVARFCSFLTSLSKDVPHLQSSDWRIWLPYASTAIPVLIPVLFAASIFVLFTRFASMVVFESEVA